MKIERASEPERTYLQHEGHYSLQIKRALNLYRLGHVLFVIEGVIERGPAPEYEGKQYAHVCRLPAYGAWNAKQIADVVGGAVAELAQRAWDRSMLLYWVESDEEKERERDEQLDVDAIIAVDVVEKDLRHTRAARRVMVYSFSKES